MASRKNVIGRRPYAECAEVFPESAWRVQAEPVAVDRPRPILVFRDIQLSEGRRG